MHELHQMNLEINKIFHFIGTYRLFGIIPLDIIAHLFISTVITVFLLKLKKGYGVVFLTMIIIGSIKEYYDSFVMTSHILEHVKDMAVNLTYPTISFFIHKIKTKE
jgi:hypothetical protein